VIVGSALVRHLAEAASKSRDEMIRGVENYVGRLAAAMIV
jgi:tryptophan synthase alpha subunit